MGIVNYTTRVYRTISCLTGEKSIRNATKICYLMFVGAKFFYVDKELEVLLPRVAKKRQQEEYIAPAAYLGSVDCELLIPWRLIMQFKESSASRLIVEVPSGGYKITPPQC